MGIHDVYAVLRDMIGFFLEAYENIYLLFWVPAAVLIFYVVYRICFHRERWYVRTCLDVMGALPEPIEFWRCCRSRAEFDSVPSAGSDAKLAGDPYFRFLLLCTRDEIRTCEDAYDALYAAGRRKKVDPAVIRKVEKSWAKALRKSSTVLVRWHYRDVFRIFGVERWKKDRQELEHYVGLLPGSEPDGSELLSWTEDFDEIRRRKSLRFDAHGSWIALLCPPGTRREDAERTCVAIRYGCGRRPLRTAYRRLRRKGRRHLFRGREGEVFLRSVAIQPKEDYYCPEDVLAAYSGRYGGRFDEYDERVFGEIPGHADVPEGAFEPERAQADPFRDGDAADRGEGKDALPDGILAPSNADAEGDAANGKPAEAPEAVPVEAMAHGGGRRFAAMPAAPEPPRERAKKEKRPRKKKEDAPAVPALSDRERVRLAAIHGATGAAKAMSVPLAATDGGSDLRFDMAPASREPELRFDMAPVPVAPRTGRKPKPAPAPAEPEPEDARDWRGSQLRIDYRQYDY